MYFCKNKQKQLIFSSKRTAKKNLNKLKMVVDFNTGGEKRDPEELASAMITIVQSINDSKSTDSYVEPFIKAITDMLKEVDD
jgi:hypothetical protein